MRPSPTPTAGPIDLFLAARPTPILRAIVTRLGDLGHLVAAASPARSIERLSLLEPRLVVLDLEACTRSDLVRLLHARGLPIVVLGSGAHLRTAMAARTLGARKVVGASFSVDELATSLAAVLAEIPVSGSLLATAQTTTLGDLLSTLEQEMRAGLARYVRVPAQGDVRFTVRDSELIATYVRRLRAAVSRTAADVAAAPCELTGDPVPLLAWPRMARAPMAPLEGARLVLVDSRVSRADAILVACRAAGASVFPCAPEEFLGELSRIADLDPTAILVEDELGGTVERLLAEIGAESRLRFSRLIAAPLGELWDAGERALDTDRLFEILMPSHLEERTVAERLLAQPRHGVELATLGPARLLHALALARVPARLTHIEASCLLRIELANDGVVAGAQARLPDRNRLEGPAALAVFLRRTKGTVDIQRLMDPTILSVFAPVPTAIGIASREPIPVVNSSFPPGPVTRVSWSSMPAPVAGRITWTSIPSISDEELSAYAIKDPAELLDAVDDDEEEEPPTAAFNPGHIPGVSLRMPPPPAIEEDGAGGAESGAKPPVLAAAEPAPSVAAPGILPAAPTEPVAIMTPDSQVFALVDGGAQGERVGNPPPALPVVSSAGPTRPGELAALPPISADPGVGGTTLPAVGDRTNIHDQDPRDPRAEPAAARRQNPGDDATDRGSVTRVPDSLPEANGDAAPASRSGPTSLGKASGVSPEFVAIAVLVALCLLVVLMALQ
ncbi:MAG: hypothetical protein JW751_09475 [Polyangiaceae bacterium]|nr:hypothetical protein [Polyangiaceae bacterium]